MFKMTPHTHKKRKDDVPKYILLSEEYLWLFIYEMKVFNTPQRMRGTATTRVLTVSAHTMRTQRQSRAFTARRQLSGFLVCKHKAIKRTHRENHDVPV